MTELPSPDELAEAEDNIRTAIRDGEVPAVDASLPIVMAEFDRLRLVEQAATTLVGQLALKVEEAKRDLCCPATDGWGTCGAECATLLERYITLCEVSDMAAAVHGENRG